MTENGNLDGHLKDPELAYTAIDHAAGSTGEAGWYVSSVRDPGQEGASETRARYAQSGPHTLEAATRLLKAIQDHPEPGGPEATETLDEIIEKGFLNWITEAATRISTELKDSETSDEPDVPLRELVTEILDAAGSYTDWRRH